MNAAARPSMAVVWILITGIAYFFAAKIAMVFAIPPGYATAIWPAAGIALVALLKFGYRLWPGVLLGSFLANLTVPGSASLTTLQFTDLILPFAIASGATLQAVIGRWLARRSFDNEFELIEVRSILSFVLLVGFVGCLTSSIIGVTSLVAAGAVAINDAPFNWLNWWVGDSLGVILVTPLVYAAFGAPEANWGFRRRIVGVPLLAALVVSAAVFHWIRDAEETGLKTDFAERTGIIADVVEKRFAAYVENLYAIRGLIQTNRGNLSGTPLRAGQFQDFVDFNLRRLPGVQALSWNPVVLREQRARVEQDMDRQGFEGFAFTERGEDGNLKPAESREKYVVVQYIEPFLGNQTALGFDVYSNPARRKAMDQARDLGQPVATEAITLVQEHGAQRGILVFLPVYAEQRTPEILERRRESLIGYAVGVFRIGDVLSVARSHVEIRDTITYVSDITESSAPVELAGYAVDSSGAGGSLTLEDLGAERHPYTLRTVLDIGTRIWQIEVSPTDNFFRVERSWAAWGFLEGILFLAAMFTVFLLNMTGRTIIERSQNAKLGLINTQLTDQIEQRKAAERELEKLATHDSLTGLSNRRVFDGRLEEIASLADRYQWPFSVLMIDLDFFKNVNDSYGHPAGDEVLRRVAKLLSDRVRGSDIVARYGGDEFAAILNNTGEREAVKIAESIRSSVEQCQVIWGDTTISITTSIGIAQFPAHGVTGAAVVDAADKALYAAKQAGRNQVRVAS